MYSGNLMDRACLIIFCVTCFMCFGAGDVGTDFFWQITVGKCFFENGSFPTENQMAFTLGETAWASPDWLFDVLIYPLHKYAGWTGLIAIKALLLTSACFFLVLFLREKGLGVFESCIGLLVAIYFLRFRAYLRAEIATLLFLSIYLWRLEKIRFNRTRGWELIAISLLWVHLHAGVVLGWLMVGCYAAGEWINRMVSSADGKSNPGRFAILGIGCAATILTHPFLKEWPEFFASHRPLVSNPLISEFMRIPFQFVDYWLVVLAGALALIVSWWKSGRFDAVPFCLYAGFSIIASSSMRGMAIFALVCWPWALVYFKMIFKPRPIHEIFRWISLFGLIVISIWSARQKYWFAPDLSIFPIGAEEFVGRNHISGKGFNEFGDGGYLLWKFFPEKKVFMHSRHVCIPLLIETDRQRKKVSDWTAFLDSYGIEYAIDIIPQGKFYQPEPELGLALMPRSPLVFFYPSAEWALVYWDDRRAVFLRRRPSQSAAIQKFEYHYYPDDYVYWSERMRAGLDDARVILAEIQRSRQQGGDSEFHRFLENYLAQVSHSFIR